MAASKILITDDDVDTCEILSDIFRERGYGVVTAGTGSEAVDKAGQTTFDVALIDIRLPDMEGVELIAALKGMQADMVVVMITGYASVETAVRALNEGASAYILKPLNMDEVLAAVKEALEKRRLVIENRRLYEEAQRELAERKRAEEALQRAHDELEMRVAERTAELAKANKELRTEIMERKQVETALLKAKESAEAASRAKSEFLAVISHELRTPLNAVIGFSEILADQTFGELNERQLKFANSILKSGRLLLSVVNDILDLAEVEAGKTELELSEFDASGAIQSVLDSVKSLADKKNIALKIELEESLSSITADEAKFKQIINNLLSNAVKFTPENGSIRLEANLISDFGFRISELEKEGKVISDKSTIDNRQSAIEISVADSGIGVKPEDQERIFHTFEQINSSYSREQEGTGLGLALTKKLVELHGGRIWVESEGQGKGSTFTFVMPANEAEIKPEA